jgi:protein-S-isoprenylcysteine O-methyltransferase Ste14
VRRLIRHLVAVAALPFVVTVIVPLWLARRDAIGLSLGETASAVAAQTGGVALLLIGVALFASSLRRFATEGDGTLAPWDPPRRLVVRGPYRHVRNPMISGVVFVLLGEAAVLRSEPHLVWALVFLTLNALFIPLFEEPQLRRRFGVESAEYCRHVPRLVPRLTPWTGGA